LPSQGRLLSSQAASTLTRATRASKRSPNQSAPVQSVNDMSFGANQSPKAVRASKPARTSTPAMPSARRR